MACATNDERGHEADRSHRSSDSEVPRGRSATRNSQGPLVLVQYVQTGLARQGSLVVANMFGAPPAARIAWQSLKCITRGC